MSISTSFWSHRSLIRTGSPVAAEKMATPPRASPMPDPGSGEEDGTDGELAVAAGATGERWKRRPRRRRLGTGARSGRKREEVTAGRAAVGGRERRGSEAAVVAAMARGTRRNPVREQDGPRKPNKSKRTDAVEMGFPVAGREA